MYNSVEVTGERSGAHGHIDLAVRLIAFDDEIVRSEIVDREFGFIDRSLTPAQLRERSRFTCELDLQRFDVIAIDVGVAELEDELVRVGVGDSSDHVSEQSVRSDVERDAETKIGGTLIQEAG